MKKILFPRAWIIISLLSLFLLNFDTTGDAGIEKIIKQLEIYRINYAQQKIDLHTDKESYMTGENIWMKCYLIEASSFMPDSVSKEIYVDLIDYSGRHIQRTILRNKGGFSNGNMLIRDTVPEGCYKIYAYTSWMKNFDSNYFFSKTIKITNPNYENIITKGRLDGIYKFNKKFENLQNEYMIHFFPEGGDIISGFNTRVAFKAENMLGNGVDVSGSIYSDKGEKITDFKSTHLGMGLFTFTPGSGVDYYAKVVFNNNRDIQNYELPKVSDRGVSMTVDPFAPKYIRINLRSNRIISGDISANRIILIGQSRGVACYISKGELNNNSKEVLIPKERFPAGIVQFTLFNTSLEPLCERLIFIDYTKESKEHTFDISKQISNDSSRFTIKLSGKDGQPVPGNFSLSVSEIQVDENTTNSSNILSHLLLTSDLKGKIENPAYYFSGNESSRLNLDLVMLTNGWRRFVWKDLLSNTFPEITYGPSQGIAVEGKISRNVYGTPFPNSTARLSVLSSYNDIFQVKSDDKGRFLFSNLDYEDTVDVNIEAFGPSGEKGVFIHINDSVILESNTIADTGPRNVNFSNDKIKANNQLERVLIRKKNKENAESAYQIRRIYSSPDATVKLGPEATSYSSVFQYMQGRVPGVSISGNKVTIRGINTIYGSTDPLFLLDGVPMDASSINTMNINDIAVIDVLKGPSASIFGSRGANGVIAFYSRHGESAKSGIMKFKILGYQKTREFYVPSYETWNYKPQDYKIPRTLFWAPEVIANSKGEAIVKFKNPFDSKISRRITVEGLTASGEIIYYQEILN